MRHDAQFSQASYRGTDGNSLLRMYDAAREASATSLLQLDRLRADRALLRIVKELRRRKIYLGPAESL